MKRENLLLTTALLAAPLTSLMAANSNERPNILWIVCEDLSPYLGCYGFHQAVTPNLDKLAEEGVRYTHAYSNAPVSGVARSTLLTGMYASTTGSCNFRTRQALPAEIPTYPEAFRAAGYYCTNNSKTDYNSSLENRKKELWDDCSDKADYRNRPEGTPFMAVYNIECTHENYISLYNGMRQKCIEQGLIPESPRLDPKDVELPPYHPDVAGVRADWSYLHDMITLMDKTVGEHLAQLEASGEAENTIVFFYSDHGGPLAGSKRTLYTRGTDVPLIIRTPKKWAHLAPGKAGSTCDRVVEFVDLPKSALALAGIEAPELMQGRIFLGEKSEPEAKYVPLYKDRTDERFDLIRAITDGRYRLIRNYNPHRPHARDARFMYQAMEDWVAWRDWFEAQEENPDPVRSAFFLAKPTIELFDDKKDPWNVENLAQDPKYKSKIKELDEQLDAWMISSRDMGLIPEWIIDEIVGSGKKYATIYEYAQSSDYDIEKILPIAKQAAATQEGDDISKFIPLVADADPTIRNWAIYALRQSKVTTPEVTSALEKAIASDKIPGNRIKAIEALSLCGGDREKLAATLHEEIMAAPTTYSYMVGLNAIQYGYMDKYFSLDFWKSELVRYKKAKTKLNEIGGYSGRLIDEAIKCYPEPYRVY